MDAAPTTFCTIELARERRETPSELARSLSTLVGDPGREYERDDLEFPEWALERDLELARLPLPEPGRERR